VPETEGTPPSVSTDVPVFMMVKVLITDPALISAFPKSVP
jgi:hypothetical protein